MIEVDNFNCGRRIRRFISNLRLRIGELRPSAQPFGWEANDRIKRTAGFTQQYKRMTAAHTTSTAGTTRTWARSGCFTFKSRVDAGLNCGLQLLNVGQVAITRRCWRRFSGGYL